MNTVWKRVVALAVLVSMLSMWVFPAAAQTNSNLLTDIPVTGVLPGGGTFEGVLSVTELAVSNGQLLVSGVLEGTATNAGVVTEITQTFTQVVGSLLGGGSAGQCDILFLDLGP